MQTQLLPENQLFTVFDNGRINQVNQKLGVSVEPPSWPGYPPAPRPPSPDLLASPAPWDPEMKDVGEVAVAPRQEAGPPPQQSQRGGGSFRVATS